jgi:hypothetical protein
MARGLEPFKRMTAGDWWSELWPQLFIAGIPLFVVSAMMRTASWPTLVLAILAVTVVFGGLVYTLLMSARWWAHLRVDDSRWFPYRRRYTGRHHLRSVTP